MAGQGTMLGRANLEAAFIAFSTVFDMKLKNTPVIYPRLAMVIPGVSERLEFKWLGSIPTMKKWIGDRTIQKLRGETLALTTDWWANGIEVDVDDFKVESRLGMLATRVRSLAEAAARRIDDQVAQFYLAGTTGITLGTSYDGVQLYSNSHTAGTGAGVRANEAQSNLVAGGLSSATFNSAIQKSLLFQDDEGEPIVTDMRTVLCGPTQQLTVRQLFKQEYNAAGASNPDYQMADAIIAPRFGLSTAWMLLTESEIKSVIVGIEYEPQFAAADDPASPEMFKRRTALYGAHVKFGTIYGPWQGSVGSAG